MTYDTIKLQDALDTLEKIGSLDTPEDRKYAREMFLNIPSALLEHLTDEDLETIRIHLYAFMEGLCNQHRWKEAEEYERIIVRLKYLAMSQLEPKTGHWVHKHERTPNTWECSNCGYRVNLMDGGIYKFCSACGEKKEGEG